MINRNIIRRIAVFSVYDKDGVWGRYRSYILEELRKNSEKVIVVVNGIFRDDIKAYINERDTEIIYRENKGFDAGAYKSVIIDHIGLQKLCTYNELVLCNDTFFGPFVSFSKIFSDMEKSNADFWGLFRVRNDEIVQVICSCFYVFRLGKNLRCDIYDYFDKSINQDLTNIYDVYRCFEIGLYSWLISKKYKDDTYVKQYRYDINTNGDMLLARYNFPIIKKKFFLSCHSKEKIVHALQLMHNMKTYDINMILEYMDLSMYKIRDIEDVIACQFRHKIYNNAQPIIRHSLTREELVDYIEKSTEFYIYGVGIWGNLIYGIYSQFNNKCKGVIVSDSGGKYNSGDFWGKYIYLHQNNMGCAREVVDEDNIKYKTRELPVYEYDNNFDSRRVIVALSFENTKKLIHQIGKKDNWLYLW